MAEQQLSVLIVGANGNLGRVITYECLKRPNFLVNILIRDPDKDSGLVEQVKNSGGKCFVGDVTNPESIKDCTKGVHTVISALNGDNRILLDGQKNLLDDALRNGVKRFVPSDFLVDIWNMNLGEHFFADQRLKFRQILDSSNIKALHITCGVFMETYMYLNREGFTYWGNIDQPIDLTAEEDVAKYLVAAVAKPERAGDLRIVGDEHSTREIVRIYNEVTGKNVEARCLGSVEDLIQTVNGMKNQGKLLEAVELGYAIPIFDGRGKIFDNDNDEFPEVDSLTFEAFLKKYHGKYQYPYSVNRSITRSLKDVEAF